MSAGRGRPDRDDPDAAAGRAASLVTGVTLAAAFGLLAAGVDWFWVTFPVGLRCRPPGGGGGHARPAERGP